MRRERHVLFGPPGTGKTTALLNRVRFHLSRGVRPERIGFVSFTRRAIAEAKAHAPEVELPYVRTIHSLAYFLLELRPAQVVTSEHLATFGRAVGVPFGRTPGDPSEGVLGDVCLAVHSLAVARGVSLNDAWRALGVDLPWRLVRQTIQMYTCFKRDLGLLDFDDMILRAEGRLDLDVLCIDEAQDTSTAQWAFLRRVAAHVPVVYFAGDDDQAIYHWAGADATQLLRFRGDRAVLPVSYRLPRRVKALADRLAATIRSRVSKVFAPRPVDGRVTWINEPEAVDLHQAGTWLLLARNNYQLQQFRHQARQQGVVYSLPNGTWSWSLPAVRAAVSWERLRKGKSIPAPEAKNVNGYLAERRALPRGARTVDFATWFPADSPLREHSWLTALPNIPLRDREYIRALRRSGESLTAPGRVTIGTVHSAKGAEADHVVLLTDISAKAAAMAQLAPDAERRVQYVAVTRARESLTLVLPQTGTAWNF